MSALLSGRDLETWAQHWCDTCTGDAAFRAHTGPSCPILKTLISGGAPTELHERGGQWVCRSYHSERTP